MFVMVFDFCFHVSMYFLDFYLQEIKQTNKESKY